MYKYSTPPNALISGFVCRTRENGKITAFLISPIQFNSNQDKTECEKGQALNIVNIVCHQISLPLLSATKSLYRYCLPSNPCTIIACHQIPVLLLYATKSLYIYCLPSNPFTVIVCHQIPVPLLSATKSLFRYCLPPNSCTVIVCHQIPDRYCLPLNSCTIIVLPPNPCTVIVLPPNPCTIIVCHKIPVPLHYSSLVLGSSRARYMYGILTQYIILYSPHLSPFLSNY